MFRNVKKCTSIWLTLIWSIIRWWNSFTTFARNTTTMAAYPKLSDWTITIAFPITTWRLVGNWCKGKEFAGGGRSFTASQAPFVYPLVSRPIWVGWGWCQRHLGSVVWLGSNRAFTGSSWNSNSQSTYGSRLHGYFVNTRTSQDVVKYLMVTNFRANFWVHTNLINDGRHGMA